MCPIFNNCVLKNYLLIFKISLIVILFCNLQYIKANRIIKNKTQNAKCLIGQNFNNGKCVELHLLRDEPWLESCDVANCSHGCISIAGKAFCACPDDMELGEDWKTCQQSNEEINEDEDNVDVEDTEGDEDENEAEGHRNDGDYEEEYEDEIENSYSKQDDNETGNKELQIESNNSVGYKYKKDTEEEQTQDENSEDNSIKKNQFDLERSSEIGIYNFTDNSEIFIDTVNKEDEIKNNTDANIFESGNHTEETDLNLNKEDEEQNSNRDIISISNGEHAKKEETYEHNDDEDDYGDQDESYDAVEEDADGINEVTEQAKIDDSTTQFFLKENDTIESNNKEKDEIEIAEDFEHNNFETTITNAITNQNKDEAGEAYATIQETTEISVETTFENVPEETDETETSDEEGFSKIPIIYELNKDGTEEINDHKIYNNEENGSNIVEAAKDISEITEENLHNERNNNNVFSSTENVEESTNTETSIVNIKEILENEDYKNEYEEEYEDENEEATNKEHNEIIPKSAIAENTLEVTAKPIITTAEPCEIGFEQSSHNSKCTDINECENQDLNPCAHGCVNTMGHFYCICDGGYELSVEDNSSCLDIDECRTGICSHGCINSLGAFECTCPDNYYLQDFNGGTICEEISCTHGYDYNKHRNKLVCVCPENYFLARDNSTCVHNGECEDLQGCSQFCRNRNECFCRTGFVLLQDRQTCQEISTFCQTGFAFNLEYITCEDIDECSNSDLNDCTQVCVNNVGSYECDCSSGFQLEDDEISCADVDECTDGLHECEGICFNNIGGYACGCEQGFVLAKNERNCYDVNECLINNGQCSHLCENLFGGYNCTCPDNFELQYDNTTCRIIDLCLENNGNCSHGCLNIEGTVICTCPQNYEVDGKSCKKINPCQINNGGCEHFCELNNEFIKCKCPETYKLHNDTHCDKINPCFEFNNGCSHICDTINDTAVCKCPDDTYELVEKTCHKINPCVINNGNCSHDCFFLDDTIHCSCPSQYELLEDSKSCQAENPCRQNNGNCSHECLFKDGIKQCLCPNGLQLKLDQLECQWVDACQINNGGCSHLCESVSGQAICKCPQRLELVNKTCVRINPCLINNGGCSHFCHSTFRGRVKCSCPSENYILNGQICLQHDICRQENGGCNHICSQEYGRRVCKCQNGFLLRPDGFSCKEINECKIGNGGCSHGCTNTVGSYNCTCPKGLILDDSKLICQDIDECQNDSTCDQICTNYHAAFRCSCTQGYVLAKDGRSCDPIGFSECPTFSLPNMDGANVRCLGLDLEGRKYVPIDTRCIVWCLKGYKLHGEAIHLCQNTGNWSSSSTPSCVRTSCPKVVNPKASRLIPSSCTSAKTFVGEKCRIYCKRSYKNMPGLEYIQCQSNLQWSTIGNRRVIISPAQLAEACVQVDIPKPFIICPEQGRLTFELPIGQKKMVVHIPRPKSNVDWWRYIDSEPPWAKTLTTTLNPGRVEVKFTAYSPVVNETSATCNLVIDVKDTEPPTLTGCPEDISVQLRPGERQKNVYWQQPDVADNVGVTNVYISKDSGSDFEIGRHYVDYVASDAEGNRAYCHFNVIVKGSAEETQHVNKLRAVLVCPDGIHVAETENSNDRNNAQRQVDWADCHWKHVRVVASSQHLPAIGPSNYFQRQYPDPYRLSHGNYRHNSNRIQSYKKHQQQYSYTPFSWYHKCC